MSNKPRGSRPPFADAAHLPNLRGGLAPDPSYLPQQRAGRAPQGRGRYPDFDVLGQADGVG